jgi:hypothetical protein
MLAVIESRRWVMKKAMIALIVLLGIILVVAIPLGVIKVKASSETHTFSFVIPGCFPKHLPDAYNGLVLLAGLPDVPSEVQGVYWYDDDEWLFWAPGAPGCTLSTMGGGRTFDYLVCVTGPCEWEIPLSLLIPTPTPVPTPVPLPTISMSCVEARNAIQDALSVHTTQYQEWPTADGDPGDIEWTKLTPDFMAGVPSNDSLCDWWVNSDPEGTVCLQNMC